MRVKLLHNLQPSEHAAHSVILEDDTGTPIFVALQLDDRIVYADVGEPDFYALLKTLGVETNVRVAELAPKPLEKLLREK